MAALVGKKDAPGAHLSHSKLFSVTSFYQIHTIFIICQIIIRTIMLAVYYAIEYILVPTIICR